MKADFSWTQSSAQDDDLEDAATPLFSDVHFSVGST